MKYFFFHRYKTVAKKVMQLKLELAKQRKEFLQKQKRMKKTEDVVDHFKNHWVFREETLSKNVEIFKQMKKTKEENIKVKFIQIIIWFSCFK